MGKKSRTKKAFRENTTPEERKAIKQRRRDSANAKESEVLWIEKKPSNELKYHRGYIACWKDRQRYVSRVLDVESSEKSGSPVVQERLYPPLLRGTFAIKDRV